MTLVPFGLLACHPDTADTGLPPACQAEPCAALVASEIYDDPGSADWGGQDVVASGGTVVVAAPGIGTDRGDGDPSHVGVLDLRGLRELGRWEGTHDGDLIASLDLGDPDLDGVLDFLVGRSHGQDDMGPDYRGVVHLLAGPPTGTRSIAEAALLSIYSPESVGVGNAVAFADLDLDGVQEIVASGFGDGSREDAPGVVYAFDPSLRGIYSSDMASRQITGSGPGMGETMAVVDADADGTEDVAVSTVTFMNGVALYLSPWFGDLVDTDADATWSAKSAVTGVGESIAELGDVTGDGAADLGIYEQDTSDIVRAGRVYLIPGGDAEGGLVEELAVQVHGLVEGDAMGRSMASGDVDGDGAEDLVVGASGVYPGVWPGRVLVFSGPLLPGVLTDEDAMVQVHGEYDGDSFGMAIVAVDADADARADLVVSAQGWPAGGSDGRVYLLLGADLLP